MVIIVVMLVMFVGIFALDYRQQQRRDEVFRQFAERFHLVFAGEQVSGTHGSLDITLREEVRSGGKSQYVVTVWDLTFLDATLPSGLNVSKEGLFAKIGKLVGGEDIQLQIPGLDQKLLVRGVDEFKVREWANDPTVTQALHKLATLSAHSWRLSEVGLYVEIYGRASKYDALATRATELIELAEGLSSPKLLPW